MPLFVPGEKLGGTEITAADAASTAVVGPFGNYKYLTIYACVTGYVSGGGIFALRFGVSGGAIDTGTNYRWIQFPRPTSATATQPSAVISSTTTAPTMMQLAQTAINGGRMSTIEIMNRSATVHTASWVTVNEASSDISHTSGQHIDGSGSYHSAAAGYITSVQMVVNGTNMTTGTGFVVYGHNHF